LSEKYRSTILRVLEATLSIIGCFSAAASKDKLNILGYIIYSLLIEIIPTRESLDSHGYLVIEDLCIAYGDNIGIKTPENVIAPPEENLEMVQYITGVEPSDVLGDAVRED